MRFRSNVIARCHSLHRVRIHTARKLRDRSFSMGNAGSGGAGGGASSSGGGARVASAGGSHSPATPATPRSPSPPHGEAFVFPPAPQRAHPKNPPSEGSPEAPRRPRPRSNTVSESTNIPDNRKLPTVFKWAGGGKQVFVSGTFNAWDTLPMVKSHGDFVTIVDLPEGEHQFKFFVDGVWRHDPGFNLVDNGMGSKNNLVSVKQSDFEVFEALDKDSENANADLQKEYCQDIPQKNPWDKVTGPPILPPHLLQVMLNKDTPLSCEPTLLPEPPNHVMLNHLYALSIKDGVMVLSATHRFRKKYVTTLLYKPI